METSYAYRQGGERLVLTAFEARPAEQLVHLEHTCGPFHTSLVASRLYRPAEGQTVEEWLAEKDRELRGSGWGTPLRIPGACFSQPSTSPHGQPGPAVSRAGGWGG